MFTQLDRLYLMLAKKNVKVDLIDLFRHVKVSWLQPESKYLLEHACLSIHHRALTVILTTVSALPYTLQQISHTQSQVPEAPGQAWPCLVV